MSNTLVKNVSKLQLPDRLLNKVFAKNIYSNSLTITWGQGQTEFKVTI